MESILDYLLESALVLGLLVGFYRCFLHNLPNFAFNRFFLLLSTFVSILIPLLHFGIPVVESVPDQAVGLVNVLVEVTVYPESAKNVLLSLVQSIKFHHLIYVIGLFTLLLRMGIGFIELDVLSNHIKWKAKDGRYVVYLPGSFDAFSFFNLIFINKCRFNDEQLETIYAHEKEHVKYKHSYDIVFLELLLLFQWFNPFVWVLRGLLKEVHEFQVDRSVLSLGFSRGKYKALLLEQATGSRLLPVNNFSQSLTKKRFVMMNSSGSSRQLIRIVPLSLFFVGIVSILFAVDKQLISVPSSLLSNELHTKETEYLPQRSEKENVNESMIYIAKDEKMTEAKQVFFTMEEVHSVTTQTSDPSSESNTLSTSYENNVISKDRIYYIVDDMPEYPGGQEALRQDISSIVRYPESAQRLGLSGKVYVNFIISPKGNIEEVTIARGVYPSLNEEALRVIRSLAKWRPGKLNGIAVPVSYTVPINFVLQ